MKYILNLLLVILILSCSAVAQKCEIDVRNDFGVKGPLIISPSATKFLYPNHRTSSKLKFSKSERLRVSCPGNSIMINETNEDAAVAEITCDSGKKFKIGRHSINFPNITCRTHAKAIVKKIGVSCATTGRIYDIGFEIDNGEFLPNIELCHDSKIAHTYWSHGIVVSTIQSRQNQPRKGEFNTGKLFVAVPVKNAYKVSQQAITFEHLFTEESTVNKYISKTEDKYFARGHLFANADGYYQAQQESTFFFANVVPMWQKINNGNWKEIEILVRKIADDRNVDLDVWTGSLGILTLRDSDNKAIEIYLTNATVNGEHNMIPAPKILFKYVYDKKHEEGIVFLTANNPYAEKKDLKEYIICKQHKACTDILRFMRDVAKGYTYCCTVRDFLEIEDVQKLTLPDFSDVKPLIRN